MVQYNDILDLMIFHELFSDRRLSPAGVKC